jgi:bacillithiol biosynthesis deacetylase BshB1
MKQNPQESSSHLPDSSCIIPDPDVLSSFILPPSSFPLDCLAIGAHPDDAELFAGGTLALAQRLGRRVGILDLTRGECATRGTAEMRIAEARAAADILGLGVRETLDLGDGDLANSQEHRKTLVEAIRRLRPRIVLTHGRQDRHPDHRRAHELVQDAIFMANVGGFPAGGERWRVEAQAYFLGNSLHAVHRADWIVDVSQTFEIKLASLRAYQTQFLANSDDPHDPGATYIASSEFWDQIGISARLWGHRIGVGYGEPFLLDRPAHLRHPLVLLTMPAIG